MQIIYPNRGNFAQILEKASSNALDPTVVISAALDPDDIDSEYISSWISMTKAITKDSGIKFIPGVNFKTETPIRQMVSEVLQNPDDHGWGDVVKEIWQFNHVPERYFAIGGESYGSDPSSQNS